MGNGKGRIDRLAAGSTSLLIKLGLLLIVSLVLRVAGVFPELMEIVWAWILIGMAAVFGVALFASTKLTDTEEAEGTIPFNRPGQEPGRRTWKHDVYDENAYAILGVPQNATRAQIRDAFRRLMQEYHPDAATPEEKERVALIFVRLDQAYELLSHVENRARYDAWIEHLGGAEPPLDTVTDIFKDGVKLAQFDAMFPQALGLLKNQEARAPEPEPISSRESVPPTAAETNPSPTLFPEAQTEPSQPAEANNSPLEVDIPDAVREALGLPEIKK